MTLRLPEKWLWDFWFARDGVNYHVFYLQADRLLGNPDLRHWHSSIGHAVSQDLVEWEVLPNALQPGASGAWDDYTTWTGSIILHQSRWYLFYTGTRHAEDGLVQRIGLAMSDDLMHWEKHPDNPLIVVDPRWYEELDLNAWHDQAWRDPWVFQHPETGLFHAFITSRVKDGPADARGVIGHAVSNDLIHWEIRPPLTEPGEYGQMEVPQLAHLADRYYLLFSVPADSHSQARASRLTGPMPTGTQHWLADQALGPFRPVDDTFLVGDSVGQYYSGKLVELPTGDWAFMAFLNSSPHGDFIGELSDPMPLRIDKEGRLSVLLP